MFEPTIVALCALFVLLLIVRLVRGYVVGRRLAHGGHRLPAALDAELQALLTAGTGPVKAREVLRQIQGRLPSLGAAEERAIWYCAAGHLCRTELKRPAAAVSFYLKALRETPDCVDALAALNELLVGQGLYRRLELTYWDVLSRLDDDAVGSVAWRSAWNGLASIYARSHRTGRRADAIRKMLAGCTGEETAEDRDVPTAS